MILSAIAAKLKQRAAADFRDRHDEASLIVQPVSWYLRYPPAIMAARSDGLLPRMPVHYVTKHL